MKKWLITLAGLTLAVAATTAVTFAVVGDGSGATSAGSGEAAQYEVTVRFNTSVTQEDIEEVDALLRAYDDDLELLIMESFPPIGRALLSTDATDVCQTVEADLEAESYVDGVSCGPWVAPDQGEPDTPVHTSNEGGT